ncbi:MAG: Uncharacterized protein CEN91_120 [Candidatus Berkelbacteria bacterium Licking1014_85]|uniref:Type II toxin-antitoxin system mRNA interferase toxin, RelE/StbE family n=1 Tax=Candidatus Berkelbacteria bacterium Licking1014_85 TaxID=2017148 RepID=A0A554LMC4_9BACT|nr:MAG: Uncharacterized protein CEN91_120 [Candidatus Berkelbacteria bacterium Licking1014_85]
MKKTIRIIPHKNFTKQLSKQSPKVRTKAQERLHIFMQDPFNRTLNNHALTGKWDGHRSINISGDIRAIYKHSDNNIAIFIAIGSHSSLYR